MILKTPAIWSNTLSLHYPASMLLLDSHHTETQAVEGQISKIPSGSPHHPARLMFPLICGSNRVSFNRGTKNSLFPECPMSS